MARADKVFLQPVFGRCAASLSNEAVATMVQVHPGADHSFVRPDLHADPANVLRHPAVVAAGGVVPASLPADG